MFLIPAAAGVIGLAFGALVLLQFAVRRRPHQAAWGAALVLFGAAALWEAAGIYSGWDALSYKAYYLLGGVLNVGWLGVGSLYVQSRRAGHVAAAVMALVTLVSIPLIVSAGTDATLLRASVPGRGAITGPVTILPIFTNIAGSIALIGGAAWSAWSDYRSGLVGAHTLGTVLIAVGAFVVAGTHSFAQVRGVYAVQPLGEAVGIAVMFAGYLAVERRPRPAPNPLPA